MSHDNEPVLSIAQHYAREILYGGPIGGVFECNEREKILRELESLPMSELEKLSASLSAHAERARKERRSIIEITLANLVPAKK